MRGDRQADRHTVTHKRGWFYYLSHVCYSYGTDKDPTTPKTRRYTILWNISFRKLIKVNQQRGNGCHKNIQSTQIFDKTQSEVGNIYLFFKLVVLLMKDPMSSGSGLFMFTLVHV